MKNTTDKRNEIIEAAFRIWGKNRYINTSLSDLAAALGVTKQAIYRHFTSKEKLEKEMENKVIQQYSDYLEKMKQDLQSCGTDNFFDRYSDYFHRFIKNHLNFLSFLAYRYRQHNFTPDVIRKQIEELNNFVSIKTGVPVIALRYLNSLLFFTSRLNKQNNRNIYWKDIWENGFKTEKLERYPDFNKLLNDASLLDYSNFNSDPLVKAVFETVIEEAGNGITVGKIAKKAGLTKSSLYNYWPSKEEMLSDVISRQVTVFSTCFENFSSAYSSPQDILFSYIAFSGTFFRRTPQILNYLRRVITYEINIGNRKNITGKRFTAPLENLKNDGLINTGQLTISEFTGLINMATANEIKHQILSEASRTCMEKSLIDLYMLITGGFEEIRRLK